MSVPRKAMLELVGGRAHRHSQPPPLSFDFATLLTCWPDIRTDQLWAACRLAEVKTRLLLLDAQTPPKPTSTEPRDPSAPLSVNQRTRSDIDIPNRPSSPANNAVLQSTRARRHSFSESALGSTTDTKLADLVPQARLSRQSVSQVLSSFRRFTPSSALASWSVGNSTVVRVQTKAKTSTRSLGVAGAQLPSPRSVLSSVRRPDRDTAPSVERQTSNSMHQLPISQRMQSLVTDTDDNTKTAPVPLIDSPTAPGQSPRREVCIIVSPSNAISIASDASQDRAIALSECETITTNTTVCESTSTLDRTESKLSNLTVPSPSSIKHKEDLSLSELGPPSSPIIARMSTFESISASGHSMEPNASKAKEALTKELTVSPLRDVPDSIVFTRPLDLLLPNWDYFRYLTTSLPFIGFMFLTMISWFATQLFQHFDYPGLVAYYLLAFFFNSFSPLLTTERRLIRPLVTSFEFSYLVLNVILFVGAGTYSLQSAAGSYTAISFGLVTFISLMVLIMVDFFPRLSHGSSRAFIAACCMLVCAYTIINDRLHIDTSFDSHNLCRYFIYCVDTKRVMYSCGVTLFLYNGRYLVQFLSDIRNNRNSFLVTKTPIVSDCTDVTFPADPRTGRPGLTAVRIVRVTLNIPAEFRDHFGTPLSELRKAGGDRHQSTRNNASSTEPNRPVARPHHEFLFSPLNPSPWMHRIAASKVYQGAWIIIIAAGITILTVPAARKGPLFLDYFLATASVGVVSIFIEATRIDRSLFFSLLRRFEFYIVLYNSAAYAFFAALSSPNVLEGTPPMVCWFFVALILILMDAAPSYPPLMRKLVVVLQMINSARVFYLDRFTNVVLFEDREFCLLFCASTRVMTLTALFNITLFFAKYTWTILRNPRRCIILRVRLRYLVEQRLVGKDPQGRLKQVTDLNVPLVPVTGFFNFKTPARYAESCRALKAQLERLRAEALPYFSRVDGRFSVIERTTGQATPLAAPVK